jgi:hypothetical protein
VHGGSVSTRAFIASVSTALVGRQGLQQPLGLPVVLGPAAPSMLAWLRCPPCSAMNTVSTTSLDWNRRLGNHPSLRRPQHPDDVEVTSFPGHIVGVPTRITPLPRRLRPVGWLAGRLGRAFIAATVAVGLGLGGARRQAQTGQSQARGQHGRRC